MRVPYIINPNTYICYDPSEVTRQLLDEVDRKLIAEDLSRTNSPTLVQLCIECIARNFDKYPTIINELVLCADRDYLLEILPTDLPLSMVVPIIEDAIYWKRCFLFKYGISSQRLHTNWTWKCIYMEHYMQNLIEQAQPEYNDEENMEDITTLLDPFVHVLHITELQSWKPPLTLAKEEIPEIMPVDHINLEPIFRRLTNIEELDLTFGIKHVGEKFSWNMFKISLDDAKRLGQAVLNLNQLRIFALNNSCFDDNHMRIFIKDLMRIASLEELRINYCMLGDDGALCIAKMMMNHEKLQKIVLINNKIGGIGGEGIGFALMQESCCPIKHLNLRLNPLGHKGVMGLFRALVRVQKLEELIISGCGFDDDTSIRLAAVIQLHKGLKLIDVSNNWCHPGEENILDAMKTNRTLHWLDLRMSDISDEAMAKIKKRLAKNRRGDTEESDEETELEGEQEEEEESTLETLELGEGEYEEGLEEEFDEDIEEDEEEETLGSNDWSF